VGVHFHEKIDIVQYCLRVFAHMRVSAAGSLSWKNCFSSSSVLNSYISIISEHLFLAIVLERILSIKFVGQS
jgi:hypothetical protein